MLVVLSEIECLGRLHYMGVYPDMFFTDFEVFKNQTALFDNADVVFIIAGSCQFNKHVIIDKVKELMKRELNPKDNGINSVNVVTDVNIPNLRRYYKFIGDIDDLTEFCGWKNKGKVHFWDAFKSEDKNDIIDDVYLSDFDSGVTDELRKEYQKKAMSDKEDNYVKLIYKPDVEKYKHKV